MKKILFVILSLLLVATVADAQLKFVSLGEKSVKGASTVYTDIANYASCADSIAFLFQNTDTVKARVFIVAYPYPGVPLSAVVAGSVVDTVYKTDGASVCRYALKIGTNPALLGYYGIGLKVIVDSVDVVPTGVIKTWISGY